MNILTGLKLMRVFRYSSGGLIITRFSQKGQIRVIFISHWEQRAASWDLNQNLDWCIGWHQTKGGHVDTSMLYRTYGRYIPNLTRRDGSAFERLYAESTSQKLDTNRHNFGHNGQNSCPCNNLSIWNNLLTKWWRRRESNPRPKTFHFDLYILILKFKVSPRKTPSGWIPEGLVC